MEKLIIFDFNGTLYLPERQILDPEAFGVLETLSAHRWQLHLLSTAAPSREELIRKLGLGRLLSGITLVERKTGDAIQDVLRTYGTEPSTAFIVGDRVQDEIALGNRLGLVSVWLQRGRFADRSPRTTAEAPRYRIERLSQLLPLILGVHPAAG